MVPTICEKEGLVAIQGSKSSPRGVACENLPPLGVLRRR
jgi:hypothetical protein